MAEKIYKTKKNLQTVWDQLDEALGNIENATYNLSCMTDIPKEAKEEMERIEVNQLIVLRDTVGKLLEMK